MMFAMNDLKYKTRNHGKVHFFFIIVNDYMHLISSSYDKHHLYLNISSTIIYRSLR